MENDRKEEAGKSLAVEWLRTKEGQEILRKNIEEARAAAKKLTENMSVNIECLLKPVTL